VAPFIAWARARRVRANYEAIGWSPIVPTTVAQVEALLTELGPEAPPTEMGMMFVPPTIGEAVERLQKTGVDMIIALALFPHFSTATTGAALSRLNVALAKAHWNVPIHPIRSYHNHPLYVEALVTTVRKGLSRLSGDGEIHLLFSPHGLPLSTVESGDPYPTEIRESVRLTLEALRWTGPWHIGWQSRLGPTKWLSPSTREIVSKIARDGGKRILVVPVSFVSEHIETLHELDVELAAEARALGITDFGRAPAVGLEPVFIRCLAECVRGQMN
jgi:ferrochelatase